MLPNFWFGIWSVWFSHGFYLVFLFDVWFLLDFRARKNILAAIIPFCVVDFLLSDHDVLEPSRTSLENFTQKLIEKVKKQQQLLEATVSYLTLNSLLKCPAPLNLISREAMLFMSRVA
uniref:AlNc14C443G11688 protein n=1 Tax=Albugo laibachii Nc14 TaxID=890382 RepID=F0WZU7_9STRA|nr:AlNc14C443G11688 [Albugo laibachii Nc14]|eukprot:CCA27024.1 AlNc14C443G11688 [Albugo laibachii Nc14]